MKKQTALHAEDMCRADFLFFSEIRASFKHDGTDIFAVYEAGSGVMLKSKRRADACRFSGSAGGVLDSYTALSREIRTETATGDKKVVDSFYDKGTEGQLVPRFSVVRDSY